MIKIVCPIVVIFLCLLQFAPRTGSGQNDLLAAKRDTDWQAKQALQHKLETLLHPIIQTCLDQGLKSTAKVLQKYLVIRDPQRQYIFLPPENPVADDRLSNDLPPEIRSKVNEILNGHAEALFALAKTEVASGNGAVAFQLLHEILFFAPNHESVRKILGHRIVPQANIESWQVSSDRFRIRRATRPNDALGWPAKTWSTASTAHFQIASRGTDVETEFLARSLERWHDVWRQVFFEYHSQSTVLENWLNGKGSQSAPRRKFKVVFFGDKDDYVAGLSRTVPGVEASTGYYSDQEETSYFFASDDRTIHDTWRHEMSHQMLQESRRSIISPFQDEFLWLGEGIAMYFESLADFGDYVTLGGFDTRRVQYARLRRIKEQFHIPLEQLSKMNRVEFQSQADLAKIYSQSAGVAHYLMNANQGQWQPRLIDFLQLSYQGKLKSGSFEKIIGKTFDEIDAGYAEFLKIQRGQLEYLNATTTQTELALIAAPLEDDSLAKVAQCTNLSWLDLSACDVRGQRLVYLKNCEQLEQLFLTGAIVDAESIRIIAQLPIRELDLSGSNLGDSELDLLAESKTLASVNLAGTKITDQGLDQLRSRRPNLTVNVN